MTKQENSVLVHGITFEALKDLISETINTNLKSLASPSPKSLDYLTRAQTAELLHISLPTLSDFTKRGYLKGYKISTRVLYKRDEIEQSLTEIQSQKYRRA